MFFVIGWVVSRDYILKTVKFSDRYGLAFQILHKMGFGDMSDEDLLQRYAKTKDQKWISQLFGRYVQLIYGVCLRYNADVRQAEDYTMEIYEKVVVKAQSHQIKQFKSWVYVLSKNYCLEQIRKMTGRKIESFDPAFMQLRAEYRLTDEDSDRALNEEKYKLIDDCLKQLTDLQKKSIQLFYYQNKTYVEIADIIESEVSQVRSYLQNGRRNMKKCVERKQR